MSRLLPLGIGYLQDIRFTLACDGFNSDELRAMIESGDVPADTSGALVDHDAGEIWITRYSRPYDIRAVYECHKGERA